MDFRFHFSFPALDKQGFTGSFVESWAASEIRKLMSFADRRLSLFFWRTQTGQEADFLIERAGKLVAVPFPVFFGMEQRGAGGRSVRKALKVRPDTRDQPSTSHFQSGRKRIFFPKYFSSPSRLSVTTSRSSQRSSSEASTSARSSRSFVPSPSNE